MTTIEYLDAVKKRLGITSDYGLQVPLGVKKQSVSNYRNQRSAFEQAVALRVAKILELPPEKVIADMELERAATDELRAVWKRIARKVATVAVVAIGAGVSAAPSPAEASNQPLCSASQPLCIM